MFSVIVNNKQSKSFTQKKLFVMDLFFMFIIEGWKWKTKPQLKKTKALFAVQMTTAVALAKPVVVLMMQTIVLMIVVVSKIWYALNITHEPNFFPAFGI